MNNLQFLCRAKPRDAEQEHVWKKLVENTLEPPGAWEAALPAGKGTREKFQAVPAASTGNC